MGSTLIETPLRITPEEYLRIEELVEVRLEYADGLIIPKEGSKPLPNWVVNELLKPDFDENVLNFEFPMATQAHDDLMLNLQRLLYLEAKNVEGIKVYGQGPKIYVSLRGKCRVPDVTVSPDKARQVFEKDRLVNPMAIFEMLSDSTASKDHNEKLEECLSIESLQEYFLVSQDEIKIERDRRNEGERWEYEVFRLGELPIGSIDTKLKLEAIYEDIF